MIRTRLRVGVAVVGLAVVVGLAGCGVSDSRTAAPDDSVEAQVLASLGFDMAAEMPAVEPAPSQSAERPRRAGGGKGRGPKILAKRVLHAEAVVETKEGIRTVQAQRGTVTAVDDRTVTVKSTDGFTLTWTFGNPIRVVERRNTVQPNAIKAGATVGVSGQKDGATSTAKLILITP